MTQNQNYVVIYSNGIADFQRCYEVRSENPERISIPVRQDHLADVLASFNVYGNVQLDSPPTYRPSNELAGNISINPQQVLEDLATNLSGAKVRVERAGGAMEGTLVGLHQEVEATAGEPIHPKSVIVLADDGLRKCALREIQNFQFLDQDVQTEIDKALQRNYQRIKPNSTFVELVLSTQETSTEAIVQYTIPASAWKISYRLRIAEGNTAQLQGFAIVDNNTDEDWTDFRVCVVTGEPITFSTDLAESKIPSRNHVDLVSETALGAVEVEEDMVMMGAAGAPEEILSEGTVLSAGKLSSFSARRRADPAPAKTSAAEIHEVGDFSIFESDSLVSIPAKRSAVIPVFTAEIAETKSVLHYKHSNHPERPYRSAKLTNQTGFSLGRGVCTVFEGMAYSGNCIVPALKPGESQLLPHALESGVKIRREQKRLRKKDVAIRIADGVCYTSTRQRREIHYLMSNARDQEYELVLDHDFTLREPEFEAHLVGDESKEVLEGAAKLADGIRYRITLAPKANMVVTVVEQRIDQSQVELVTVNKQYENVQVTWLEQNLVRTNGPLASNDGIQACLQMHQDLESKQQEITDAVKETERLAERQERLRENIKSGGQDELSSRWRADLDAAEQKIREIEEVRLLALRKQESSLRRSLRESLKSLTAEWSQES